MSHGHPDWGIGAPLSTVYTVQDGGEVAARLWSPDVHDRRGNVIFMDGFEDGLQKWTSAVGGAGSAVAQDNTIARGGGNSCKLTMGAAAGRWALIAHPHPVPRRARLGFEASFRLSGYEDYVEFYTDWLDTTIWAAGGIRYDIWDEAFQYYDENGHWTEFEPGWALDLVYGTFHSLKYVIDLDTYKYVRMIIDHEEIDMSSLDMFTWLGGWGPRMYYSISNANDGSTAGSTYIDDVIITRNEP